MSNARRPRLVEEGKPIMSMEEDLVAQDNDDNDSFHHIARGHSSSSMYHYPNHQHSSLPNVLQQNQSSSSLIQYLSSHYNATTDNNVINHNHRNIIPSPNKKLTTSTKLQTKFIIGSSEDDTNIDDDDDVTMDIDQVQLQDQEYKNVHSYKSNHHPHISSYKDYDGDNNEERMIQRMEIEDIIPKPPLIVLDGANIAYAYVQTFQSTPSLSTTTSNISSSSKRHGTINSPSTSLEPNALGIKLAVEYFLHAGCRVQVVVPAYWIRNKQQQHQQHQHIHSTRTTTNKDSQHLQILHHLQEQNILCCSPPTDDDDAYCIAIARREDGRSRLRRKGRHYTTTTTAQEDGISSISSRSRTSINATTANTSLLSSDITMMDGAFIVSNDLYRDAIYRDPTHDLKRWLDGALSNVSSSVKHKYSKDVDWSNVDDIPRRISYSFADLGSIDTYGDAILDFVPNPRHALISMIDGEMRKQFYSHESF
jgi:hypothetical protein